MSKETEKSRLEEYCDCPGCLGTSVEDRGCRMAEARAFLASRIDADAQAKLEQHALWTPKVLAITHFISTKNPGGIGLIGENTLDVALRVLESYSAQEAELYAAQDQVVGLQEIIARQDNTIALNEGRRLVAMCLKAGAVPGRVSAWLKEKLQAGASEPWHPEATEFSRGQAVALDLDSFKRPRIATVVGYNWPSKRYTVELDVSADRLTVLDTEGDV